MSDKAHQPGMPSRSGSTEQARLDSDIVNQIKSDLSRGLGSPAADQARPPRKARGSMRPRAVERQAVPGPAPLDMQPIELAYRRVANEKVSLRQGDKVTEVTRAEAAIRSQFKLAIEGNARAQEAVIREMARADARQAAIIAEDHKFWRYYRDFAREEIAEAKKLGLPAPTRLPHPDDIVFQDGKPVRFIGPMDEEGRKRFEHIQRERDQMILWMELDERVRGLSTKPNRMERLSSAYLYMQAAENALPPRMRLSEIELILRTMKAGSMSKRDLLKTLHAGWRALGQLKKRGTLPPPLEEGLKTLKMANDLATALVSGEIDSEKFANGIIDDHTVDVLERIGITSRAALGR